MTLHSAKGLEFPVVFIVGLEENVLPHARSISPERNPLATADEKEAARRAVEEERRLFYVGITRAKERLYLVYATIRSLYGDSRANLPSRFLYDIPEKVREGAALSRRARADREQEQFQALLRWDRGASLEDRPRRAGPAQSAAAARFKGGDLVWHSKYGEGVVLSVKNSGDMELVDVLFPGEVGQKTIVADFLKRMEE
jgi:DNA helicase-2/ATP-dependent DNA helicase PcrA